MIYNIYIYIIRFSIIMAKKYQENNLIIRHIKQTNKIDEYVV